MKAGVQLSPDALNYLDLQPDPVHLASKTLAELDRRKTKPLIITRNMLEEIVPIPSPKYPKIIDFNDPISPVNDKSIDVTPFVEVMSSLYEESSAQGKLENFLAYFRNRYEKMVKLFKARKDALDAISINEVAKVGEGKEARVIGLVTSKRETDRGVTILELEDPTGVISVLISTINDKLYNKVLKLYLIKSSVLRELQGIRKRYRRKT